MQLTLGLAFLTATALAAPAPAAVRHYPRQTGASMPASTGSSGGGGASSSDGKGGSYTVGGLGQRKQAVTAAGGNDLSLAVAMLETDNMQATYTYGDGKTQDSANFGIFKQNWSILRQCCSMFQGQQEADWNNGAKLNQDLNADVQCLLQCQQSLGLDKWFGGHRDGSSGLQNPNSQTVQDYKTGVQWIQQQVDSQANAKSDDTRYYYQVPAI